MDARTEIYESLIKLLSNNKKVVDIACSDGWAGKIALEAVAESVTFADARLERFIAPSNYTNYELQFIDLNSPKMLHPLLAGCDTAIYFGHLYHSNNHEDILDTLINSDCKDFLIDTKIDLEADCIDLESPSIFWHDPEPVSDKYNGWHSTDSHIKTGAPNLAWMLAYFKRNNLEIKFQKSIDSVFIKENCDPYHHRIYIFHITKSNN